MMNLTIDKELLKIVPDFHVTAYEIIFDDDYNSMVKSNEVDTLLDELKTRCMANYNYDEITKIDRLLDTRTGYKMLGKDPSHTRPACEALLRRLVKGSGLYRLGDVIDLGNILSVETLKSVCVVDSGKLVGDIYIRQGKIDDIYEGISRGLINVDKLPIYTDDIGPFGCPTSDNARTCVTSETKGVVVMIIYFNNNNSSFEQTDEFKLVELYTKFTKIKNINKIC